jgi:hypothetical protein
VKIMLDCSREKIVSYRERLNHDFWQLRTPLTNYARAPGIPYGLDNGCFKIFAREAWEQLLDQAEEDRPVFVCLPDVVADAARTLELFEYFKLRTNELPRALVLQDGIERVRIPWDDIDAVFVGGTDRFKYSAEAINAARTAKMLGRWVHVGRVNTAGRVRNWLGLADSVGGSGTRSIRPHARGRAVTDRGGAPAARSDRQIHSNRVRRYNVILCYDVLGNWPHVRGPRGFHGMSVGSFTQWRDQVCT